VREIAAEQITQAVRGLCIEANHHLGGDVLSAIQEARKNEESPLARSVLGELEENAAIRRLWVKDFPVVVMNDAHGRDLYEEGLAQFRKAEASGRR
jgi:hypothetical protein